MKADAVTAAISLASAVIGAAACVVIMMTATPPDTTVPAPVEVPPGQPFVYDDYVKAITDPTPPTWQPTTVADLMLGPR